MKIHKENVLTSQSEISDIIAGTLGVVHGVVGVGQSGKLAGRLCTWPSGGAVLMAAAVHVDCTNPLALSYVKPVRGSPQRVPHRTRVWICLSQPYLRGGEFGARVCGFAFVGPSSTWK